MVLFTICITGNQFYRREFTKLEMGYNQQHICFSLWCFSFAVGNAIAIVIVQLCTFFIHSFIASLSLSISCIFLLLSSRSQCAYLSQQRHTHCHQTFTQLISQEVCNLYWMKLSQKLYRIKQKHTLKSREGAIEVIGSQLLKIC